MKNCKDNLVCVHCNTHMHQHEVNPEHLDINTQSLVLMFRVHQLVAVECPECGYKGLSL